MAKVEISVDTSKKNVVVKLDGKTVKDVSGVWISTTEGGFFALEVTQFEEIDDDTRKVTRLVASKDDDEWKESTEGNGAFPKTQVGELVVGELVDLKTLAEVLLQRKVT